MDESLGSIQKMIQILSHIQRLIVGAVFPIREFTSPQYLITELSSTKLFETPLIVSQINSTIDS